MVWIDGAGVRHYSTGDVVPGEAYANDGFLDASAIPIWPEGGYQEKSRFIQDVNADFLERRAKRKARAR